MPPSDGVPVVAAATAGSTEWRACPRCGGVTRRVTRRWSDRLLSLFEPRVRRRCLSFTCSWEGRLRDPGRVSASPWKRLWAPTSRRSTRL